MSFIRPASTILRASALRPAIATAPRAQACLQTRFASSQGYGDGKGMPAAEDPQKQGKNPSEEIEHPGPPPPKVAQGKGKSADENAPSSNKMQSEKSTSQSSTSSSKGSSGGSNNKDNDKGTQGAQPKILNENPPSEDDPAVREHNKDMENRAERAHERVGNNEAQDDKVSKGFWSGTSESQSNKSTPKSPRNASFWASVGLAAFVAGNWVFMGSGKLGFLDVV